MEYAYLCVYCGYKTIEDHPDLTMDCPEDDWLLIQQPLEGQAPAPEPPEVVDDEEP